MEETTTINLDAWNERIGKFATAVGKTLEEVTEALKIIVGDPGDDALLILANKNAAPDTDISEAMKTLAIPTGKFKMHVEKLRGEPVITEAAASKSTSIQAMSILPEVPNEESFLVMLKTGGVLKVEITEIISAVKAAFAKSVDLYDLPKKLFKKIEDFAINQEESCGAAFYDMQKLITQNRYGDVLSVIGVDGKFVSEERKKVFFERLDAKLFPALKNFHLALTTWQQAWMQGMANPQALIIAMTAGQSGNPMPSGIMAPPDTAPVRASAEEVVNEINRVFAGTGIPVARALAYDATRIMRILDDPKLPAQVGATNKEQMLKDLGINVGSEIVRTEQNIVRYTVSIMSLDHVAADSEIAYLAAMVQLGSSIPWDKLGVSSKMSGIGSRSANEL